MDKELLSEQIRIERKRFTFSLRENPRGRFLKITEDVGGRRDTVIVPHTGLSEFCDVIEKAITVDEENEYIPPEPDGNR